jgi:hypothetical protein
MGGFGARPGQEVAAPPFEAEKRPDQQAVVDLAGAVLVEDPGHVLGLEELEDQSPRVSQ